MDDLIPWLEYHAALLEELDATLANRGLQLGMAGHDVGKASRRISPLVGKGDGYRQFCGIAGLEHDRDGSFRGANGLPFHLKGHHEFIGLDGKVIPVTGRENHLQGIVRIPATAQSELR
jgi:hypothetical protein